MCNRRQLKVGQREIMKWSRATFEDGFDYIPREEINGFAHLPDPIIKCETPSLITGAVWGLVPAWSKKPQDIWDMTLNARIESAETKPAFRDCVTNRCLVPSDGFFEWRWEDPKGKKKTKYLINYADEELFAFAGLYSVWTDPMTQQKMTTYTILTTDANPTMAYIHNNKKRMPVILKKEDCDAFLNAAPLENFAYPAYDVPLIAFAV